MGAGGWIIGSTRFVLLYRPHARWLFPKSPAPGDGSRDTIHLPSCDSRSPRNRSDESPSSRNDGSAYSPPPLLCPADCLDTCTLVPPASHIRRPSSDHPPSCYGSPLASCNR